MTDYKLEGLNTRDFQHLVQAIARKNIAPGVTSFGDGKDGARDFTFKGKMNYPSLTDAWDGYLVGGCKFRQSPFDDSVKNTVWALKQLELDLKKFLSKKRKLPKPEYYLFVTNLPLSGTSVTGGRDQAVQLLRSYSPLLGLKGYGVWDYNDLRGFIDGDSDIRSSYGHFITAGDVLATMQELLCPDQTDFMDIMHTFLQKELIADMSAKLQSAGEDPDVQIPLANVFVDLPFSDSAEAAVLQRDDNEEDRPKIVEALLEAGAQILRRTNDERASSGRRNAGSSTALASRFVVVGGPGQGKSTLGQYLCQLYRAALLKDRPSNKLDDKVPGILKQLNRQQNADLPTVRRFPIRIELRTFAHALMGKEGLTVLEYIRRDISRLGSAEISTKDLKKWFTLYPWLLVLDGLDEVPPSSNRSDVLKELESFRVDVASGNWDTLIIATTRPQSYSKDFSDDLFLHLYLIPLSPNEALQYGRKLVEARCGDDSRRKDELIRSLEKACTNEATSRLMQSPLQVTIMATLLEDTGEPPQQRYRLFFEYYRTIYKRETRRKLLGGILSQRQSDIDVIHANAGLLLHVRGEKDVRSDRPTDDVDSALSDIQFRELVSKRLSRIGIPAPKAVELLDKISSGTLQRLVFLVRQREGWVQFDIASFKEFMAAEALMMGADDVVRDRLKATAAAIYWRNVFQFAVGKCFVEREYLLDSLVSICLGLNESRSSIEMVGNDLSARAAEATLWGSRLALDILADGTASQYPGYESQFVRIALQLLRSSDQESCIRLSSLFHDDLTGLFRPAIEDRLGQSSFAAQLGAWSLLGSLADRDVVWAQRLIDEHWPAGIEEQKSILVELSHRARRAPLGWSSAKLKVLAPWFSPFELLSMWDPHIWDSKIRPDEPLASLLVQLRNRHESNQVSVKSIWSDFTNKLFFSPCFSKDAALHPLKNKDLHNPKWLTIVSAVRFAENPTAKVLAAELRELASQCAFPTRHFNVFCPWPLAACLTGASSKEVLLEFARAAEDGLLGDSKQWALAEQRWRKDGVTVADFAAPASPNLPFDSNIALVGFPFSACSYAPIQNTAAARRETIERLKSVANLKTQAWLASLILASEEFFRAKPRSFTPAEYRLLFVLASKNAPQRIHNFSFKISLGQVLDGEWIDFLGWLGQEGIWVSFDSANQGLANTLIQYFSVNPNKHRGLLPVLASLAMSQTRCVVPKHILDIAKSWDEQSRHYALSLSLAGNSLTGHELESLAVEMLKCETGRVSPWMALRMASASSSEQAAEFALQLLRNHSTAHSDERRLFRDTNRILVEYMTTLPSRIQQPEIWRQLALPDLL